MANNDDTDHANTWDNFVITKNQYATQKDQAKFCFENMDKFTTFLLAGLS